jgi:hypothetical protein
LHEAGKEILNLALEAFMSHSLISISFQSSSHLHPHSIIVAHHGPKKTKKKANDSHCPCLDQKLSSSGEALI